MTQPSAPLAPARVPDEALPVVTVIVPCRNEVRFIASCLSSILEGGYRLDRLQILVVDGMSVDGTREAVARLAERYHGIELVDNPRLTTPVALNIGIRQARGDYVLWMSAHNRYEPGYIGECIRWAVGTGADNVGGVIVTAARTAGLLADAITATLTHRFGVGGSAFRLHTREPCWADTVFGGCYRRDVFERFGLFNEALTRGQDMEFNLRLRRAGARTLLVPTIRSTYFARTRLLEYVRHNWRNGVWAILPFRYSAIVPVSPRHLVPMTFAAALVGAAVLSWLVPGWGWVWLAVCLPYGAAALAAAADIAWRRRQPLLFLVTPFTFAALHLCYGLGSLWGAFRTAWPLGARLLGLAAAPAPPPSLADHPTPWVPPPSPTGR